MFFDEMVALLHLEDKLLAFVNQITHMLVKATNGKVDLNVI